MNKTESVHWGRLSGECVWQKLRGFKSKLTRREFNATRIPVMEGKGAANLTRWRRQKITRIKSETLEEI